MLLLSITAQATCYCRRSRATTLFHDTQRPAVLQEVSEQTPGFVLIWRPAPEASCEAREQMVCGTRGKQLGRWYGATAAS